MVVVVLLGLEIRLVQIHQRARIDVDVPEASGNRLGDQILDLLNGCLWILGKERRLHLKVIALDEYRS